MVVHTLTPSIWEDRGRWISMSPGSSQGYWGQAIASSQSVSLLVIPSNP